MTFPRLSLGALRRWFATGPNRIALSTALRGTIATVVPLVLLPLLGIGPAARFAVIGSLNVALVDVGGPYRNRLLAMLISALLGPILMMLGMESNLHWAMAAAIMAAIALGGGLVRSLGPGGTSLGLNNSVSFLTGLQFPGEPLGDELVWAFAYVLGGLWTVLVTLAFWQLRPYRRLEQEMAGIWEAVAALVAAARPAGIGVMSVVLRRRHEQQIGNLHRQAREAMERIRASLGETREGTRGTGTTLAQLVVLLRSASRIDAAIVTLEESSDPTVHLDEAVQTALAEAVIELEKACRAIARLLLVGHGDIDFEPMRQSLAALSKLAEAADEREPTTARVLAAQILALAQAVRQLNNAEEAVGIVFGPGQHLPSLRLPPLDGPKLRDGLAAVRAQLTTKSVIFRHALRVALVSAVATAAIVYWDVPHGFWLPMSALVILQPDYGGTLTRALQRTAGTLAGAVIAGLLLATLHGTAAFEAAIALLLFAMFLLLRRRYGHAVTFLTPLIILLLGLSGPSPWRDLLYRITDTLVGAGLALAAGYLLWPLWERERLPQTLARAIGAGKDYLTSALDALAGSTVATDRFIALRIAAEVEAVNADAAFQRMLSEPRHQRGRVANNFALDIYIQRLARHSLALAGHLAGPVPPPKDAVLELRRLFGETLEDVAAALAQGRAPQPLPRFDEPLEKIREALTRGGDGGDTVAFLLGQIVSDTTSLHYAASGR